MGRSGLPRRLGLPDGSGGRKVLFGPDGLALSAVAGAPALAQVGDEQQAASALVEDAGPA